MIYKNDIVPVAIEDELQRSYLDYAMSVIVARALPDVRDGLKPVHRRILYTMGEEGFDHDKPHKKSARVVGQVISKYHPHGNDPIYGALVRMAQTFSMRVCLVNGHGNFGSMDGDKAAAMRYTEVRLSPLAHFLLQDYDKETVDFQLNYDNTLEMPTVLPAQFPNLLVNGASGIAVGMATNIPTHNLGEVMDACCALLDNPHVENLMQYIKGPDFPTGGIVAGIKGVEEAYATGRGSFMIMGRYHIESTKKDREAVIITEIPYQVNKASLMEKIASLVNEKHIEGISDLRDESSRHGVRIVIELKKDASADVIINRLYTMTPLCTSFSVNMLALHRGRPVQMGLRDVLMAFLEFRREVVTRRTQFFLKKAREKAHVLFGLSIAVNNIEPIIHAVRSAAGSGDAFTWICDQRWDLPESLKELGHDLNEHVEQSYILSAEQAKSILALRLQRLSGFEQQKLQDELSELRDTIRNLKDFLRSPEKINALMQEEFLYIKNNFATPRLTDIEERYTNINEEDLIQSEDMVVTVTVKGYIKRVPLSIYRSQRRGGRGRHAMDTREEDTVSRVFVANTHTMLLFFTSYGKAYQLKVHELPLASSTGRGKPLIGLFPLEEGETLATLLALPENNGDLPYIVFATSHGDVRKNALEDFLDIRTSGKIAMKLGKDEKLISVCLANDTHHLLLSSRYGKGLRFAVSTLRQFASRNSTGVRGMVLKPGDELVSMTVIAGHDFSVADIEAYRSGEDTGQAVNTKDSQVIEHITAAVEKMEKMEEEEEFLLSISEKGFGKRTSSYAYRCAQRGGQGVATMEVTDKTGLIVNTVPVKAEDHILLLTNKGQLLRCPVSGIRITGRKTQGVKLFKLEIDEKIVSVACSAEEVHGDEIAEEGAHAPTSEILQNLL